MFNDDAIVFRNVTKEYRLYNNNFDKAVDSIGISHLFFWKNIKYGTFKALNEFSLTIKRGERLGIIGRNGSGKTTLLKLITKNFDPSQGAIHVNGKVQSLMDSGVGFHPEYTGLENIKASLIYNGLSRREMDFAISDIIDFVELGDFIHQPVKTYSLGMLSRLGFATATAIRPDILIVDEILGAGDAYFSAKSAERMKALTNDRGTTLLLVSHSNMQIMQFCQQCLWLDQGKIKEYGDALNVVKKYDQFMRELDEERLKRKNLESNSIGGGKINTGIIGDEAINSRIISNDVSRWKGETGLKIVDFSLKNDQNSRVHIIDTGDEVTFEMEIQAEVSDNFRCKYHIYIFTLDGIPLINHVSDEDIFTLQKGEKKTIRLKYESLLLNQGASNSSEFVITTAIYKNIDLNDTSTALLYDLLDRSFRFKVISRYRQDYSLINHPGKWLMSKEQTFEIPHQDQVLTTK